MAAPAVRVRAFRPADAPALAVLFHAAVHRLGPRDYTPAQVAAWSPAPPDPETYLYRARETLLLVAEGAGGGTPLAYASLTPAGYLDHLYRHPGAAGGAADTLCAALEGEAARRGLLAITTDASEAARRLLERRGWSVDRRNDFVLRGVPIHNWRMAKRLSTPAGSDAPPG